ncbi:MAG TPA: response regulator transcription factor [Bryobacteraceae bacterium]
MSTSASAPQRAAAKPKLLFVDDHHLVLDAVAFMAQPEYEVKAVDSLKNFEDTVGEYHPDLSILDVRLQDGDGIDAVRRVQARYPDLKLKFMFLSMHAEPKIVKRAIDAGAQAYLSKRAPAEDLMLAIRTVLNGGKYIGSRVQSEAENVQEATLTDRQKEVLRLISQGCSAKEIASRLNISVRTAEFHRAAIMERLKLHSTAMMTRYAVEHGLV